MTWGSRDRDIVVAALKHAAPYIRMYKRKVFVIKAGGEVFVDNASTQAFCAQIAILHQVGVRVVVVHGGGPQATLLARSRGTAINIVQGRRITDEDTLTVIIEAFGKVNKDILDACREAGVPAFGISGTPDGPILASKRPPVEVAGMEGELVDFGFVGDIDSIDPNGLAARMADGEVPVISPLSVDATGHILNINADTVAAALAGALQAEKLILTTGAPGILENRDDSRSLISYLDLAGLEKLGDAGVLADGMIPKSAAIKQAIKAGVPRVHVISYKVPDSLLLEVFTNEGTGTLVVSSIAALSEAEQGSAQQSG